MRVVLRKDNYFYIEKKKTKIKLTKHEGKWWLDRGENQDGLTWFHTKKAAVRCARALMYEGMLYWLTKDLEKAMKEL